MNIFHKLIPRLLINFINKYSFKKKFLLGTLAFSIPICVATALVFNFSIDNFFVRVGIFLFLFGMFVVLFLFFGAIYLSVMETVAELQKVTLKWKNGYLSERVKIETNDEFKEIGSVFNEITAAYEQEIEEHKAVRYVVEQSFKKNNQLITAINKLELGVMITEVFPEGNRAIYVNPGFEKITGYTEQEISGKSLSILQGEKTSPIASRQITEAIENKKAISIELINYRKNGESFWNFLSITPVYNEDHKLVNFIGIMTDISKQKQYEQKIYELAYFDQLTNLCNVNFMKEHVHKCLNEGMTMYALLYIDIDRFKNLNSKLGFKVGNVVLSEFAKRLTEATKDYEGLLARASKDEYVFLATSTSDKKLLIEIATNIVQKVNLPYSSNQYEFYLGASIGISISNENNIHFEQLLQQAETAMYEAKENSLKKIAFYENSMSQLYNEVHDLENKLKFAIERKQLKLFYQPKISLKTGKMVGVEALVRWQLPNGEIMSPLKFIPIAEKTGLIFSLGSWVLNHACEKRKEWAEKGYLDFMISVNISAKQFKEEYFIALVNEILMNTEIDPRLLEIELTESALHDEKNARKLLHFLKNHNITVSIDDFGTGYSSLNYLRILPINTLKIDRSFIIEIEKNKKSSKLLQSIIAMGHSLDLNVIAEGVETLEQLLMLNNMGCDEIQGYFVSRPLCEEDFEDFIACYNETFILEKLRK